MNKTNDQLFEDYWKDFNKGVPYEYYHVGELTAKMGFLACAEIKDREIKELNEVVHALNEGYNAVVALLRETVDSLENDFEGNQLAWLKKNQAALSKILGGEG